MELAKKSWRVEQAHRMRISGLLLYGRYTKLESEAVDDDDREHPSQPTRSNGVVSGTNITGAKQHQQQQQQQQQQPPPQKQHRPKRKWRFRVRPRVRVHCSTIFALLRRLRDSYARVMLALAAKARDSSLLPLAYSKKTPTVKPAAAVGHGAWGDARQLNAVETKYMEYIKRSVTDGELAYYTLSLRNAGLLI